MRDQKEYELERLEREGRLSPSQVVNEARNIHSPLHEVFVWDDTVAAEKYRIVQARQLIRSFKIVVHVGNTITLMAPKFVHNPRLEEGQEGYIETVRLRDNEAEAREAMLREANLVRGAFLRMQAIGATLECTEEIAEMSRFLAIMMHRLHRGKDDDGDGDRTVPKH